MQMQMNFQLIKLILPTGMHQNKPMIQYSKQATNAGEKSIYQHFNQAIFLDIEPFKIMVGGVYMAYVVARMQKMKVGNLKIMQNLNKQMKWTYHQYR